MNEFKVAISRKSGIKGVLELCDILKDCVGAVDLEYSEETIVESATGKAVYEIYVVYAKTLLQEKVYSVILKLFGFTKVRDLYM